MSLNSTTLSELIEQHLDLRKCYTREQQLNNIILCLKDIAERYENLLNLPQLYGEWNKSQEYPIYSFIKYDNDVYLSRQFVPKYIEITDEKYWFKMTIYTELVKEALSHYDHIEELEKYYDENSGKLEEKYTLRLNYLMNELQSKAEKSAVGSPLTADSTSKMTDTTKIYVNTSDSNWYYYNGSKWTVGGVYNSIAIGDKTITPEKTTFINKSANIFNPSLISDGYYYSPSGTTSGDSLKTNSSYTAYLFEVEGNSTYIATGSDFPYVLYDSNKKKLGYQSDYENHSPLTITTSANTKYVAISFKKSVYPIEKYMIVKGTSLPSSYKPYGYSLADEIILPSVDIDSESITPENTTFLNQTVNLFDKSKVNDNGYYNTHNGMSNGISENASYACYLLKAKPNTTYTATGSDFVYILYNASGELLGFIGDYKTHVPYTINTSESTAYVGISWKKSEYPINTYMIVEGDTLPSSYQPFGYKFIDSIILADTSEQNEVTHNKITVRKNGTGDYSTLYDAVKFAETKANVNNIYDIYIEDTSSTGGTSFDILEEMGGQNYLDTITDTSSSQRGLLLKGNINLYGVGKIKLYAHLPDTATLAQTSCFSTLDILDNCILDNLTIEIKNGRYAVHDESHSSHSKTEHIFRNCKFIHLGNQSGMWTNTHSYASGTSGQCKYEYDNCIFDSSNSTGFPWDMHNSANQAGSLILFDGCEFIKNSKQDVSIKFGFFGENTVDTGEHSANFNQVFIKNVIADGKIRISPETSLTTCINTFQLHNFTSLPVEVESNYIKQ